MNLYVCYITNGYDHTVEVRESHAEAKTFADVHTRYFDTNGPWEVKISQVKNQGVVSLINKMQEKIESLKGELYKAENTCPFGCVSASYYQGEDIL
tara:strand:+ start:956 stop:1243 length:288 start_codon:yes stop_codon:yes gene_type:complete